MVHERVLILLLHAKQGLDKFNNKRRMYVEVKAANSMAMLARFFALCSQKARLDSFRSSQRHTLM